MTPLTTTQPSTDNEHQVESAVCDLSLIEMPTPMPNPSNDHPQSVTIRQEIIKAMLTRSFMKPLKGKQKEHCAMGHKLELPIGLDWMRDVNEKNYFQDSR